MGMGRKLALAAGVAVLATGVAVAQPAKKAAPKATAPKAAASAAAPAASGEQKVTGPIAVYWMSAATQSGFGMPGMGGAGGARPSAMDMMRMMQGGGGAQHNLTLQLGSSEQPQGGPPHADHQVPQGLGVGPSVPLVTPEVQKVEVHEEREDRVEVPREYQRPKGKMLIFWGCGEHAQPGQPVVIDFSQMTPEKMASGQMPTNFMAMMRGFNVRREQGPAFGRNTTYGDWPNARSTKRVPGEGSLVGDHVITGDYSPEIKFSLDQNQDFLGPLNLTTNAKMPSGAVQLGWGSVAGAQGYLASMIGGGGQPDTFVMWVSSETQAAAFALPDYLAPGDLSRMVANRSLMGPDATSCAVPQEAANAVKGGLVQMVAYGREANFVYPPRPADRRVAWNRQWEVKVRYRSATGGLLGQPMPSMGGRGGPPGGGSQQTGQQQQPQSPQDAAAARRRAILNGLGGLIPH
jgi:hypothetical protein